jgi:hypothetical protein
MIFNSVRNRLRAIGRARRILRSHEHRFAGDPDFNLARARQGFADRGSVAIRDEHLDRIIAAYRKAKADQKAAPAVYQVSNEWLPIYRDQFQPAIDLLTAGEKTGARRMFENFFRDRASTGLHGMPTNMQKAYFSGRISNTDIKLFLIDGLYRLSLWKRLLPGRAVDELVRPDIGNPYGFFSGSSFITTGAEYQHYYANKTVDLLGGYSEPTVLELGGGYGGYAYFLHKMNNGIKYIDIDLPEVLSIASFYLMAAYPDSKFVLYGEYDEIPDHGFDFLMLPNFAVDKIKAGSVDLIFNSYSLGEMSGDAIDAYVAQFKRLEPRFLIHVNHVKFAVRGAEAFGIENAGLRLLERVPAEWNLGRQLDMDEEMFLYDNPSR